VRLQSQSAGLQADEEQAAVRIALEPLDPCLTITCATGYREKRERERNPDGARTLWSGIMSSHGGFL
jgi:hypothetical protein